MYRSNMITALPKPKIDVEFRVVRRAHVYTAGGVDYPSVTKILGVIDNGKSNALAIWARREALKLAQNELFGALDGGITLGYENVAEIIKSADRQPDRLKDAAADLGTRVHEAIDAYILGKDPVLDEESAVGFTNFIDWMSKEKIRIISGDIPVASPEWGFGGRLDSVGVNDKDEIIILDWKTSNALRDEYPLQVAAYAIAFEEMYGLRVAGGKVVRFGKTNPADFESRDVNLSDAKLAFLKALGLFKAMKAELWA